MSKLKNLGMAALLALNIGCASLQKNDLNEQTSLFGSYGELISKGQKISADTEKPNALFIMPSYDNSVFFQKCRRRLYELLEKNYDLNAVYTNSEDDVYKALDRTKNIDLLVLCGHGLRDSLRLGYKEDEKAAIDTNDMEFKEHLRNLNPNAVIVLYSCSTGEGRKKGKNLANFIRDCAGRKVIAPNREVNDHYIESAFPFRIKFLNTNYPLLADVSLTYTAN